MAKDELSGQVVHGERVRLRPWQRRDTLAQELWPRYTDPFSTLWNIPRAIFFDDEIRSGWSTQRYAWAVEDAYQRMIGRISLREIDVRQGSARLGISLSQHYVSQGLGTEAMAIFLDYFFGPLGYSSLLLDVAAFNVRAVRCYERLRFEYVESEWRSAGRDPSLRLLEDPRYRDYLSYFRRGRFETMVEFYEMVLIRDAWMARR
ncbi:MAG: GNAT family N-acetyltransferase [Chloroflexales bacterium]